jgi:hypothetical protein
MAGGGLEWWSGGVNMNAHECHELRGAGGRRSGELGCDGRDREAWGVQVVTVVTCLQIKGIIGVQVVTKAVTERALGRNKMGWSAEDDPGGGGGAVVCYDLLRLVTTCYDLLRLATGRDRGGIGGLGGLGVLHLLQCCGGEGCEDVICYICRYKVQQHLLHGLG